MNHLDEYFMMHDDFIREHEIAKANDQARRDYEAGMLSRLEHELMEEEAKEQAYAYYQAQLGL